MPIVDQWVYREVLRDFIEPENLTELGHLIMGYLNRRAYVVQGMRWYLILVPKEEIWNGIVQLMFEHTDQDLVHEAIHNLVVSGLIAVSKIHYSPINPDSVDAGRHDKRPRMITPSINISINESVWPRLNQHYNRDRMMSILQDRTINARHWFEWTENGSAIMDRMIRRPEIATDMSKYLKIIDRR